MNGKIRGKWYLARGFRDLICLDAREGHISRIRQALESVCPWARNGVPPIEHTWGILYLRDLTWREICVHTGARRYLHLLGKINSTKYAVAVRNKTISDGLPGPVGSPTELVCQATVFVYEPGGGM